VRRLRTASIRVVEFKEEKMKVNLSRAALLLFTILGLAAVTGSQAFKVQAKNRTCTMAILRGGYGAGSNGLVNTSSNPNDIRIKTFAPFAEAAYFFFDGQGNVSGSVTLNYAGSVFPLTFAGTYTVNANCTGSYTIDFGSQFGITHRDLVIVDAGREVEFVGTDRDVVIGGSMKRQFNNGE